MYYKLSILFIIFFLTGIQLSAQEERSCPKSESKKANKLVEKAQEYIAQKNYSDAYSQLKQAVEEDPEFADPYYFMGLINIKRSVPNITAAEKNFRKVIEICPEYDPYVYYYLGDIAWGAQNYNETVTFLQKFLKDVDKVKTDKDYDRAESILKYAKFYNDMVKKPVPFEPRPVPGISTPADEYLPYISTDEEMVLFTRVVKLPPDRNDLIPKEKMKEKFYFSKGKFNRYDAGEEMPFPFNQADNEGGATLTLNKKKLFYTVCKYGKGSYYNCDIYTSEYDGGWGEITNLGPKVNLPDAWDSQPSISADGKTLYFVSDRKGGYGGYDLYKTTLDENGEWTTPENLGPNFNTSGNEKSPFIHSDNMTFYFSSDGLLGMGGYDIFYSKMQESGKWSAPVNLGYPINTANDEVGFFVSTDGRYGYFASNKYKGVGGWDVFYFDLYPEARPEKVLMVKGALKDEETKEPLKAKIELKNAMSKKVTAIPVDSITGEYAAVVLFRNDYIMTVKKEGYGYESKYISKEDTTYSIPAEVDLEIKPIELGKEYKLNDIFFATASFELTAGSKIVIDDFVDYLKENPKIKISIQGHTDNVGSETSNQILSENRAKSVYQYIIEKGIPQTRLTYKGFGQKLPVATNLTEEGRSRNRRTVFVVTEK